MDNKEYVTKMVTILDANIKEDLGDDDNPRYIQTLTLLLQDAKEGIVFSSVLEEPDVRRIISWPEVLTTKQMIDFASGLRARYGEVFQIEIPKDSSTLSVQDILKSKNLDRPKSKNRRRRKNKKPNTQQTSKENVK